MPTSQKECVCAEPKRQGRTRAGLPLAPTGVCAPKLLSQALLAGLAHFYPLAPFRVEHLVRADAAAGVGVEDAVDDVPAAGLEAYVSEEMCDGAGESVLTRCKVSMGA